MQKLDPGNGILRARIPNELKIGLAQKAWKNRRSLSAELVLLLERYLKNEGELNNINAEEPKAN